jgi:YfiR/HmsC-like
MIGFSVLGIAAIGGRKPMLHFHSFMGNSLRIIAIYFRRFCLVGLLSLAVCGSQAQQGTDYAIHANIIYRFTKYVDWPDSKKSGDFIIGIIGESPLYDALNSFITNKTVGSQKIVLKRYSRSETSFNCHILFIGEDDGGSLKKIAALTRGTPTLLVSESAGLALKGSCINFIVVNDHLKLEINKNAIEQRGLSIATELLSLGIVVK